MKFSFKLLFLLGFSFFIVSCSNRYKVLEPKKIQSGVYKKKLIVKQRPIITHELNKAVIELAEQLLLNSAKARPYNKIAITAFVNLDKLKNSSTFGRAISESLINELHVRNFNIIDLRTQKNISLNKSGQFYLSRKIEKLKEKKDNIYILVGTYSLFDHHSIVLNARLMHSETSEVISTGRVIYVYTDCTLHNLCSEPKKMKIISGY